MSIAKFLPVLLCGLIAAENITKEFFQPAWSETEELKRGDTILSNVFSQVLSNPKSKKRNSLIQPFGLEDLYFHNDEQEFSMSLVDLTAYSQFDWEQRHVLAVLRELRVELDMILPKLHIEGRYEAHREAYQDFNTRAIGYFWLNIYNVSAIGTAILKLVGNDTIAVDKMRLLYHTNTSEMQITQHQTSPRLSNFFNGDVFEHTVIAKMWRGITFHLNDLLEEKVNEMLTKMSLVEFLGNEKSAEKYQQYSARLTQNADTLVDEVLVGARNLILDRYQDQIKIPDIREGFSVKVLIKWEGKFLAEMGKISGISSIRRTGETIFITDDNGDSTTLGFEGSLGFEQLKLRYDRYKAKFMGIGPTGKITTKIYPLDVFLKIHINFDDSKVYLDKFKVMNVGKLDVRLEGWGWLMDRIASKVATWVVGLFRDKLVGSVQSKMDSQIRNFLKNFTIDQVLTGEGFKRR